MEEPERTNEIKGHTCVCIRPEEKLKKKKKPVTK